MQRRRLGQGLEVSALGLGCMGMSEFYGSGDDAESLETIHRALDLGVNFLDTADMYGVGRNEELVGRAVRDRRDDVVLATKFGIVRGPDGESKGIDGSPRYVRKACEASLERMGVETIDLYYQHRVDPETPIEETVAEMARLKEEGRIRHLGLSEAAPATLRRAHAVHPISALQTEYSLWSRDVEDEVLDTCRELGIGFVAYSPLGRGMLAAGVDDPAKLDTDDARLNHPRFQGGNFERNRRLVGEVEALAAEKGATPAQVALAWVLTRGDDVVPIPGTKRIEYLEQNLAALDIELTGADLDRLERIFAPGAAAGDRYHAQGMRSIHR